MSIIKKIKIANKTLKIKNCKGLSSVRGLMFDSLSDKDGALIYANDIWTPFCKSLDLYFLDKDFIILEKKSANSLTLHPKTWRVYKNKKAKYCLELKKGKTNIKKGTKIDFI